MSSLFSKKNLNKFTLWIYTLYVTILIRFRPIHIYFTDVYIDLLKGCYLILDLFYKRNLLIYIRFNSFTLDIPWYRFQIFKLRLLLKDVSIFYIFFKTLMCTVYIGQAVHVSMPISHADYVIGNSDVTPSQDGVHVTSTTLWLHSNGILRHARQWDGS